MRVAEHYSGTPDVAVNSSAGNPLLALRMLRHPDDAHAGTAARRLQSRTDTDMPTRTVRLFGARPLMAAAGLPPLPDAIRVSGLGGQLLRLHTADGDATLTLTDSAGRELWACNAQGTIKRIMYESPGQGGRPFAAEEHAAGGNPRLRERARYAPAEGTHRDRNLVGTLTEQYDNGGVMQTHCISLSGQVMETRQRLLRPEANEPDWAGSSEDELEVQALLVTARHDAVGGVLQQTNAAGVTTVTAYDVSGAMRETRLRHNQDEAWVVKAVQRRAGGELLSKTAGNGVLDTYTYAPTTQQLARHRTERPADHALGALVICDLHYAYDPAGNIVTLDDQGADPMWHRNQLANGVREYHYDSLYRLVFASGRERVPVSDYWASGFAASDRKGGRVWSRYTEHYAYDDGDNLTTLSHNGGAGSRTRHLLVATASNRALPEGHGLTPDNGFVAGGLQKQLADGRPLSWLADNQLRQVCLVARTQEGADDTERYHYADGGTRTRKVSTVNTEHGVRTTVTTYAGGCETRQRLLDGQLQKHIVISAAGDVRWVEDRLNNEGHIRYGFSDHLGSNGGETDQDGKLVCREEYAPFGETTGFDEAAVEADNLTQRTWRYSGKERDATGLYYYGWRHYQPALGRWLSADPSGLVDGHNLYRLVRNNPVRYRDDSGLFPVDRSSYSAGRDIADSTTTESPAPAGLSPFDATRYLLGAVVGLFWLLDGLLNLFHGGYREATKEGVPFTWGRFGSALARNLRTKKGSWEVANMVPSGVATVLGAVSTGVSLAYGNETAALNLFWASVAFGTVGTLMTVANRIYRFKRDPKRVNFSAAASPAYYLEDISRFNFQAEGEHIRYRRTDLHELPALGSFPLSPIASEASRRQTNAANEYAAGSTTHAHRTRAEHSSRINEYNSRLLESALRAENSRRSRRRHSQ